MRLHLNPQYRWFAVSAAVAFASVAHAAVTVAPNVNALMEGVGAQLEVLGNGQEAVYTFQEAVDASQLSAIPNGAQITAISYRADTDRFSQQTVTTSTVYSQFNILIGTAARAIGALSTTFADNEGPDTITARSGPLTIPAGSIVGGNTPNPFFTLLLSTPYTFTGGNLLVTLSRMSTGTVPNIGVDGTPVSSLVDTVGGTDTTGIAEFYNAPVIQFTYTTAPEPSTAALGIGLVAAAGLRRRIR